MTDGASATAAGWHGGMVNVYIYDDNNEPRQNENDEIDDEYDENDEMVRICMYVCMYV